MRLPLNCIDRYIVREVGTPLIAVTALLVGLFACFSGARYLAEAVTESLGPRTMVQLVFLKTVIALDVLMPIALYVSVVIGLGRLYRDQEIVAMRASGMSPLRLVVAVLLLAVPAAVLVGALSTVARPWAWSETYRLQAAGDSDLNAQRFQPNRFYGNEDSGRVIYLQDRDAAGEMKKVFVYRRKTGGDSELILSQRADQPRPFPGDRPTLRLHDGRLYRFAAAEIGDEVVNFGTLTFVLEDTEQEVGYRRKAAATTALGRSALPADVAEFQWRLSRPLATVLLALVAVPLSRSAPRRGRNERVFIAALVFAVYYNLNGMAQAWVEQGIVAPIPGVWWLHLLMTLAVVVFLRGELRFTSAARA
jgi:lipopolysaccharide export system permease protein